MLRIGFLPSDFNPMMLMLGEAEDFRALAGALRASENPAAFQPRRSADRFPAKKRRRLQTLVGLRAPLYIEGMNVAFELPAAQGEKLRREAERLGISPAELARAALTDLLADREEDFQTTAERVLLKNAELYRRLA